MVRRDLAAIHSGWANWFLRNGEYGKAKGAITEALRLHRTFTLAIKSALIRFAPSLTRKIAQLREEYRCRRDFGIG